MKIILACIVLMFSCILFGCERASSVSFSQLPSTVVSEPGNGYAVGRELYTLVETEEEARKIAEIYGIELVDFSHGTAVFHSEKDPRNIIAKGQENGWPSLEVNSIIQSSTN